MSKFTQMILKFKYAELINRILLDKLFYIVNKRDMPL